MSLSMYEATVPVFLQVLHPLAAVIDEAAALAAQKGLQEEAIVEGKLYPEMLPLTAHIGQATSFATRCCSRLAQIPNERPPGPETTVAGLRDRIAKSVALLALIKPEQMDGREDREIRVKSGGKVLAFTGKQFVLNYSLPNFFFHIASTYNILRGMGVDVSKAALLGTARRVVVDQGDAEDE